MLKKILGIIILLCLIGTPHTYGNEKNKDKNKGSDISILDTINYEWWFGFNDMNLSKYILSAIKNNSDIKTAQLKLEEYNQFAKVSFGGELPSVSAALGGYALDSSPLPTSIMRKNGLVMPLTVNYEVDIFGKNRNKTQATKKQVEAYEYQLQSIYISLVSNVSSVYLNISQINKTIELQNQLLAIKKELLAEATKKYNSGLVSDIDINNAKQEIQSINININELKKQRISLMTQLSILIGEDPAKFDQLQITNFDRINRNNINYNNITSDSIFARPDVLAYEKQMEKSKIDIKVARKEFLPTINLSGGVFFNNIAGGGFFSKDNTIFSLLGGISGDLFTGGRKKANLEIMKSRYMQMFEEYRNLTLNSVKEINDSVYTIKYNEDIIKSNINKTNLEKKNHNHYRTMLNNGLITKTDLRKTEQNLIVIEIESVSLKTQRYMGYISLYKAVGGKL